MESDKFDDTIKKKADLAKGKWADKYDSLFIPKIKYKKIDGYYNINPVYIIKDFSQQIPLSIHSLDTKTLKSNWDPFFNKYSLYIGLLLGFEATSKSWLRIYIFVGTY